jgi:hypothetical protein
MDNPIDDETGITEISIYPDGRVFLFGLSPETLAVLAEVFPHDGAIATRLACLNQPKGPNAIEPSNALPMGP